MQITEVETLHLDSNGNISKGENNTFTVTLEGDYLDKVIYENVKTCDGPFEAYFNTSDLPDNLLPPLTQIKWNVTVVDFQGDVVQLEEDYKFKTRD